MKTFTTLINDGHKFLILLIQFIIAAHLLIFLDCQIVFWWLWNLHRFC